MIDPASAPSNDAHAFGPLQAFLWGAGGSLAVEIVTLYNELRAQHATGLPPYFSNPFYWGTRFLLTVCAGGLAVAEQASNMLLAINIGAAAPAFLSLLATRPVGAPSAPSTLPLPLAAPGHGFGRGADGT